MTPTKKTKNKKRVKAKSKNKAKKKTTTSKKRKQIVPISGQFMLQPGSKGIDRANPGVPGYRE